MAKKVNGHFILYMFAILGSQGYDDTQCNRYKFS